MRPLEGASTSLDDSPSQIQEKEEMLPLAA